MALEPFVNEVSHVKPGDTEYKGQGLRDFFLHLYRDLGVAHAAAGRLLVSLVKANNPPEKGTDSVELTVRAGDDGSGRPCCTNPLGHETELRGIFKLIRPVQILVHLCMQSKHEMATVSPLWPDHGPTMLRGR